MRAWARAAVASAGLALVFALFVAIVQLPAAGVDLQAQVAANLAHSGVEHPITAVLLNFRGYDTLLEVGVLMLALLTLLILNDGESPASSPGEDEPLLQGLAKRALPLIVLAAGYLLWAGAHRPGGAFQAGAVLAAGAVLMQLAGLLPAWAGPRLLLRLGQVIGFLVFLGVAAALLGEGAMLRYPPASAAALILLIEAGLTLSLGLILAGLFLFVTGRRS